MRRVPPTLTLILYIVALLVLARFAAAQPTVSYYIPDAGAPGMAVVVEFIGPNTGHNFGASDGISPSGVEIIAPSPLVAGPCIVSNNGTVLDAMIFIPPGTPLNTSVYLNVKVNGLQAASSQLFVVVPPQHIGSQSSGGVIGTRTAFGAMVIDSMILSGNTPFTLDVTDHNSLLAGNQGYLPAIILSQGPIVIQKGSTLSVSGIGTNAGPGGGGGGGRGCDYTSSPSNGGSGFTGGGGGGANTNIFGGKSYALNGESTGSALGGNSNSLNGILGGEGGSNGGCATNGGAGGTGWTFGSGGLTWCSGNAQPGGVGGGSVGRDTYGGGGGGFVADGTSGDAPNAGLLYGFPQLVPLCGGSGGASGNPQVIFPSSGCGGDGGGGGGAVLLYSRSGILIQGSLTSNGADGNAGDNAPKTGGGGAGSGGGVILESNNGVSISGNVQVLGGIGGAGGDGGNSGGNGSNGRVRIDNDLTVAASGVLPGVGWFGPSLDTLSSITNLKIQIRGTASTNITPTKIILYVQGSDGSYQSIDTIAIASQTGFLQNITLNNASGNLFYVSAIQTDNSGAVNVMSDASGEIIQFSPPVCPTDTTTLMNFGVLPACQSSNSVQLKTTISAGGDSLNFTLAQGMTTTFTIPKPQSVNGNLIQPITFNPQKAGTFRDTMIITDVTNPTTCTPLRIPLLGVLDSNVAPKATPNSVNLGAVTLHGFNFVSTQISMPPGSTDTDIISSYKFTPSNPDVTTFSTMFPATVTPQNLFNIQFQFTVSNPADSAPYVGDIVLYYYPIDFPTCLDSLIIPVMGTKAIPILSVKPDTVDFGNNPPCHDSTTNFTVYNTGNAPLQIDSLMIDGFDFRMLSNSSASTIAQGDSEQYSIKFFPSTPAGQKNTSLVIKSNDALNGGYDTVYLSGFSISSGLVITPAQIPYSFGAINTGAIAIDTVVLRDTGTEQICITRASVPAPFSVSGNPAKTLAPGDTMRIIVSFAPTAKDTMKFMGVVQIIQTCPCLDTIDYVVTGTGALGVPSFTPLNFGTLLKCRIQVDSIPVWNSGTQNLFVDSLIQNRNSPDNGLFTLLNPTSFAFLNLPPGDTVWAKVQFSGCSAGNGGPKSASLIMYSTFNNNESQDTINLSANSVYPQLVAVPPSYIFPPTLVGQSRIDTIIIQNPNKSGSMPDSNIVINLKTLTAQAGEFTFKVLTTIANPLAIDSSILVQVTFTPSANDTDSLRVVSDSLIASYTDSCGYECNIYSQIGAALFASGFKQQMQYVNVCFTQNVDDPIGSNLSIPLMIDTSITVLDSLSVTAYISYDPEMLRVLGATSECGQANVSANPVTGIITLTIPKCTGVVQQGIFATLQCEMLIGPTSLSTLYVDSASYSASNIQSSPCPTKITVHADTLCDFGLIFTQGTNALGQNYPNPVTSDGELVTIQYQIAENTHVQLRMFDMLGREVSRMVDADQTHGQYNVGFSARNIPNGTYFYVLDAGLYHSARWFAIMR